MNQSSITTYLDALLETIRENRDGALADYIPELANVDPEQFGMSIATIDGVAYEAGEALALFTIQSISKPFAYGLVLEERGRDAVGLLIDVEPSGDAFNEISLDPATGRPKNAMINAGAIAATSHVEALSPEERFERIRAFHSACAGRELAVDEEVFRSELATANPNMAIAWLLTDRGILSGSPEAAVTAYTRQCALQVTCHDLAMMAATLANSGKQPVTDLQLLSPTVTLQVLSVMTACGMYDAAGDWMVGVGLPAKSGVGGGIIAVLPGQCGIAVFSPRLDTNGNSVRGVAALKHLSTDLDLHMLHGVQAASAASHARFEAANGIQVIEVSGAMTFLGAERIEREIFGLLDSSNRAIIVDLTAVTTMSGEARRMLESLPSEDAALGVAVALVDPDGLIEAGKHRVLPDLTQARGWADTLVATTPDSAQPASDSRR